VNNKSRQAAQNHLSLIAIVALVLLPILVPGIPGWLIGVICVSIFAFAIWRYSPSTRN
jgi:hypothetical protein